MMEGDSPELEIDSELVMSFYDQYQVHYNNFIWFLNDYIRKQMRFS